MFHDLKWIPWILFSVAIDCLLIVTIALECVARYTFINFKRRKLQSRTEPAYRGDFRTNVFSNGSADKLLIFLY
ncbi:hypothetical protein CBL_09941 [Carabus blaptoides fortunei]